MRGIARHLLTLGAAALLALGLWQLGGGLWIQAKARLAQFLIAEAWAETLAGATQVRPWPWADTWPVARLRAPDPAVDLYVLAGGSGRSLAFGPGHVTGTALPGTPGLSLLGGHRDTHFAFLEDLTPGQRIDVQSPDGSWTPHRVTATEILDSRHDRLLPEITGAPRPSLALVTCWPFDALAPGGPLRYLVYAKGT